MGECVVNDKSRRYVEGIRVSSVGITWRGHENQNNSLNVACSLAEIEARNFPVIESRCNHWTATLDKSD